MEEKKKLMKQNDSNNGDIEKPCKILKDLPIVGFRPPSFGVTILGNSHGFDCNGSTSGYILWVNGRVVMIDPPPFSS